MTYNALCSKWFGISGPSRHHSEYRRDLELLYNDFHSQYDGVMRSVFPSSLLLEMHSYCQNGDFSRGPPSFSIPLDTIDATQPSSWKWTQEESSTKDVRVMKGDWVHVPHFTRDLHFLMFSFRNLRLFPVADASDSVLCSMLTPVTVGGELMNVLYYIPPFHCSMEKLKEKIASDNSVTDLLIELKTPLTVIGHYQFLLFLYKGYPVWLMCPQAAHVSPHTVSVTRLLTLLDFVSFFSVTVDLLSSC